MAKKGLPCLDLLQATPAILRGLMTELTEEDARWKPAPERFSVAEVLAHLSHSEGRKVRRVHYPRSPARTLRWIKNNTSAGMAKSRSSTIASAVLIGVRSLST